MAAFNKFNSFVEAMSEKVHNLGSDQLMVALCATANAPIVSNTQLSNLTEISYTNLSTRVIVTVSSAQTSGTYKLVLTNLVLTASGTVATFQYVAIYNNTATNKELIGWVDLGSAITLLAGDTITFNFNGAGGVLTIV